MVVCEHAAVLREDGTNLEDLQQLLQFFYDGFESGLAADGLLLVLVQRGGLILVRDDTLLSEFDIESASNRDESA